MKVTVVGSQGMAGHVIVRYLQQQGHSVHGLTRADLDVENRSQVDQWIAGLDTDFVVNAVGMLVQPSIQRPDRACVVNAWWPQYLAHSLRDRPIRVIHLSTDCVFDGATGPYRENDPHTESNAYGRSKSLGEISNHKDLTMRTSIIGPELKSSTSLFNWAVTNPQDNLPGWTNAWWNGITTLELARCINQWINNPVVTGIYHVVNNAVATNKYELLRDIVDVWQLPKTVTASQGAKTVNKILVDTRCQIDWQIPNYRQQLNTLKQWYQGLTH